MTGGPFSGMAYRNLAATFLVLKLLGVYERELHGAIEEAVRGGSRDAGPRAA